MIGVEVTVRIRERVKLLESDRRVRSNCQSQIAESDQTARVRSQSHIKLPESDRRVRSNCQSQIPEATELVRAGVRVQVRVQRQHQG